MLLVLPTSKSHPSPALASRRAVGTAPRREGTKGPAPLRPIGPKRLRELARAIRDGTYPTEADVLGGLERLLGDA